MVAGPLYKMAINGHGDDYARAKFFTTLHASTSVKFSSTQALVSTRANSVVQYLIHSACVLIYLNILLDRSQ